MASTAIIWFRRDLRIHDHPALAAAVAAHDHVLPLFVVDDRLVAGRLEGRARTSFMVASLRELEAQLTARGGQLCVRSGRPEEVVPQLAQSTAAQAVYWTSDVSPFALRRDAAVTTALSQAGIAVHPQPGNFCADISLPRTGAGGPYTVFTPFWKAWERLERRRLVKAPSRISVPAGIDGDALPAVPALTEIVGQPFCEPGETAARRATDAWLREGVGRYGDEHNTLSGGSSGLSPYLRWGCLSPRELESRARAEGSEGAAAFVRQLAWRDFYAHVLLFHPDTLRREYQERYRELEWSDDAELLAAWQQGQTGYPVVDAGMRQLAATGWMHNRARMIVGSFLTKDLHLDWRHGERWFGRLLLDGEPAQNTGNWQWIASTGVDPAPYFRRIFNPVLQQQKFDPRGDYVRRWVPELAAVPLDRLAEPWTMSSDEQQQAGCVIGRDYPQPIVDHQIERRVAIERYRAVTGD